MSKYLTIYHGHVVDSLNEELAVKRLRWILAIGPALMTAIEFAYFSDIHQLAEFQVFRHLEKRLDATMEVTKIVVHVVVLITGIILQFRIELDHLTHHDGGCLSSIKSYFV